MTAAGEFLGFSLVPMLIGMLAAMACAIPGVFLLLRRQALLGDAISHTVLPGIVVAFLLTGRIATLPMLLGAAGAAVTAVLLIQVLIRLGRMEPGTAMGTVFTGLFAAGVLLLERSDTSGVHLDVEHALMGSLESLVWLEARDLGSLLDPAALAGLPPELGRMAAATAVLAGLAVLFWRPLALATFDPGFAATLGLPVDAIGLGLTLAAAMAAVAAFDAVGSILVIAMFVCPPAAARLMTERLGPMLGWSLGFAALSAILGFVLAGHVPLWLGFPSALGAAGMIAVVAGAILALAALFGPARRPAAA